MALLAILVIVAFLVGLSMELKLGRLIRISLAIHDQLKELVDLQKASAAQTPPAQATGPSLPAPPAPPSRRPSDTATAAEVYRID
jgi:hypothetical protein